MLKISASRPPPGPRKIASASLPLPLFHLLKSEAVAKGHNVSSYLCALVEAQLRQVKK